MTRVRVAPWLWVNLHDGGKATVSCGAAGEASLSKGQAQHLACLLLSNDVPRAEPQPMTGGAVEPRETPSGTGSRA